LRPCGVALGAGIERFTTGSLPVFATRHHVIKLFPATEVNHFETEVEVFRRVDGVLPIRTPTVVATGTQADWQYVLMTRLTGRCCTVTATCDGIWSCCR
jgi:hygromycin-B 7''-O-kinase